MNNSNKYPSTSNEFIPLYPNTILFRLPHLITSPKYFYPIHPIFTTYAYTPQKNYAPPGSPHWIFLNPIKNSPKIHDFIYSISNPI